MDGCIFASLPLLLYACMVSRMASCIYDCDLFVLLCVSVYLWVLASMTLNPPVCLYVCLYAPLLLHVWVEHGGDRSDCLFVWMSVCLSVCLSVCVCVCDFVASCPCPWLQGRVCFLRLRVCMCVCVLLVGAAQCLPLWGLACLFCSAAFSGCEVDELS
jgi:hypothetical protein